MTAAEHILHLFLDTADIDGLGLFFTVRGAPVGSFLFALFFTGAPVGFLCAPFIVAPVGFMISVIKERNESSGRT